MDYDPINRPSHYCEGRKYETIDVIEAWGLGVNLGNALKYVSRAGRKEDTVKDLEKAVWYLNREVSAPFLRRAASRLSRWILRRKIIGRIKPNDVTEDWKQSSYLSFAIVSIRKGSKRCLTNAMMFIEYEIEEIKRPSARINKEDVQKVKNPYYKEEKE